MPLTFQAIRTPSAAPMAALGDLTDASPFHTPAFVASVVASGRIPWLLGLWDEERLVAGSLGLIGGRWPLRRMEVVAAPRVRDADGYWSGVQSFCKRSGVVELVVSSWAGSPDTVPALPGERGRRTRTEYVLDLQHGLDPSGLSENHRRSIARARRLGLAVEATSRPEAVHTLIRLHRSSMDRRRRRGEVVEDLGPRQVHYLESLLRERAGDAFQVTAGRSVLSCALILRSARQAYYQFSGTSPEGRQQGASALLVWDAAAMLKADGIKQLNLGGADEDGLRRFKKGFGAREVPLEAATFAVSPFRLHLLFRAATRLRIVLTRHRPALEE